MRLLPALPLRLALSLGLVALAACAPDADTAAVEPGAVAPPSAPVEAEAAPTAPAPGAGTARITLTGDGVAVEGDYPATICGSPYILGEGWSFQTQADDWQITIASENDADAGDVALNTADGGVNVVVTANGPPGRHFVRGPSNTGTVRLGEGGRSLEADLELRGVVDRATAQLTATFTCD